MGFEPLHVLLIIVGGAIFVGIWSRNAAARQTEREKQAEIATKQAEQNAIALRQATELEAKREAQIRFDAAQEETVRRHQELHDQSQIRKFTTVVEKETGTNGIRIRAQWLAPPGAQLVLYKNEGSMLANELQVLNAEGKGKAVCLSRMKSNRSLRAFDPDVTEKKSYNYYVWIEQQMRVPKFNEASQSTSFVNITKGFRFLALNKAFIPLETKTDHFQRIAEESTAEVGALEALDTLAKTKERFAGTSTEETLADKLRARMQEMREREDILDEMMDELPDDMPFEEKREYLTAVLTDMQNKGEI